MFANGFLVCAKTFSFNPKATMFLTFSSAVKTTIFSSFLSVFIVILVSLCFMVGMVDVVGGVPSWPECLLLVLVVYLILQAYTTGLGMFGVLGSVLVPLGVLVVISWVYLFKFMLNPGLLESISLGTYGYMTDLSSLTLVYTLDLYSVSYVTLTTTMGFWAVLFAVYYMTGEPKKVIFLNWLTGFLISMVLLVSSGNLPTLMLGWELMGVFSYLLINFFITRVGTSKSAMKAFFFNKLSDLSLLLALILSLYSSKTFSLVYLDGVAGAYSTTIVLGGTTVCLASVYTVLLTMAAFCKSAQFGFHVWLPDSMEAPVPASALIHSATLVSAGVYLIGRVKFLHHMQWYLPMLCSWGVFTSLYGGLVAAYQTDVKSILAYSTISHCGFLFCSLGTGNWVLTLLYLQFHGWFKSFSFMLVGHLMAKCHNYQDFRRMGCSSPHSMTEVGLLVVLLGGLASLPFFLGFFNKHFLLLYIQVNMLGLVIFTLFLLSSLTGVFYSIKTLSGVAAGTFKSNYWSLSQVFNGVWVSSSRFNTSTYTNNVQMYMMCFSTTVSLLGVYYLMSLYGLLGVAATSYSAWGSVSLFGRLYMAVYMILLVSLLFNSSVLMLCLGLFLWVMMSALTLVI